MVNGFGDGRGHSHRKLHVFKTEHRESMLGRALWKGKGEANGSSGQRKGSYKFELSFPC